MKRYVLRITHPNPMPHRAARDAALREKFGEIEIVEWKRPELAADWFLSLSAAVRQYQEIGQVVAIEIDSTNRAALTIVALARAVLVITAVQVLFPCYGSGEGPYEPPLKTMKPLSTTLAVSDSLPFSHFANINEVCAFADYSDDPRLVANYTD